jgi:hypothetical protein
LPFGLTCLPMASSIVLFPVAARIFLRLGMWILFFSFVNQNKNQKKGYDLSILYITNLWPSTRRMRSIVTKEKKNMIEHEA